MRLHSLGPAFGLPSIDAESIAAITLLHQLSDSQEQSCSLVPCHIGAQQTPFLVDGEATRSGFDEIKSHLQSRYNFRTRPTNARSQADSIAIASLLRSYGRDLLSAHLYVSYENYSSTTRPAFTAMLPLYARFITPPALRATAIESTKHLGIRAIDADTTHNSDARSENSFNAQDADFEVDARNRASVLLPKKDTVSSLLAQRPEGVALFKLRNLADALFAPLQAMLGEKKWLLNEDSPMDVDCLAYGYLSLMLLAPVPRKWLPQIMEDSYPTLGDYTRRLHKHFSNYSHTSSTLIHSRQSTSNVQIWQELWNLFRDQTTGMRPSAVADVEPVGSKYMMTAATTGLALLAAGAWILRSSQVRYGEQLQIFGRSMTPSLPHVSDALAGLGMLQRQADVQEQGQVQASLERNMPSEIDFEFVQK